MSEQHWIKKRESTRHDCETELPDEPHGCQGDLWMCPTCRRRWRLAHKHFTGGLMRPVFAEGVSIIGADNSVYWRPFRARFVGRLGV